MLARWLVAIATALALVAPVGGYAQAGVKTDMACCCPDPTTCKCHDHDDHLPTSVMKRCAGGVHLDEPVCAALVVPEPIAACERAVHTHVVAHAAVVDPADRVVEPETRPF